MTDVLLTHLEVDRRKGRSTGESDRQRLHGLWSRVQDLGAISSNLSCRS